jgi:hypothetical protein
MKPGCRSCGIRRCDDHGESTFPQSQKILAGVPDDEQAKPAPDRDPGIGGNTACVYRFYGARLTVPA